MLIFGHPHRYFVFAFEDTPTDLLKQSNIILAKNDEFESEFLDAIEKFYEKFPDKIPTEHLPDFDKDYVCYCKRDSKYGFTYAFYVYVFDDNALYIYITSHSYI